MKVLVLVVAFSNGIGHWIVSIPRHCGQYTFASYTRTTPIGKPLYPFFAHTAHHHGAVFRQLKRYLAGNACAAKTKTNKSARDGHCCCSCISPRTHKHTCAEQALFGCYCCYCWWCLGHAHTHENRDQSGAPVCV